MTRIGVNVGVGFEIGSGAPLTALAANPVYDSPGEIPLTPRGGGFQTEDGSRIRTPWGKQIDLHLDYNLPMGTRNLTLLADAFNLFNLQTVTRYDNYTEMSFQVPNADFGDGWHIRPPSSFDLAHGSRSERVSAVAARRSSPRPLGRVQDQ